MNYRTATLSQVSSSGTLVDVGDVDANGPTVHLSLLHSQDRRSFCGIFFCKRFERFQMSVLGYQLSVCGCVRQGDTRLCGVLMRRVEVWRRRGGGVEEPGTHEHGGSGPGRRRCSRSSVPLTDRTPPTDACPTVR